jgi:hypothetical protein
VGYFSGCPSQSLEGGSIVPDDFFGCAGIVAHKTAGHKFGAAEHLFQFDF